MAFEADFTNLVAGDTNNVTDVFVYDDFSKTTTRVSIPDGIAPEARGTATAPNPPSPRTDGTWRSTPTRPT